MPTPETDILKQAPTMASTGSSEAVKTRAPNNQPKLSNPSTQSALSVASLEQFVRDHLSEAKNMPLHALDGTGVGAIVSDEIKAEKQAEEKSPYSARATEAQKAADDDAKKKEAERTYEERLLTGEELAHFNEMVEQVDQTLAQNDDKMNLIDAMLAKKKQDLVSREIVVGTGPNQHRLLVGPNGSFVDAATNKQVTDTQEIAEAKAKEKPNSATVAENQKLQLQEMQRDRLAANENRLKQQQQQIKDAPKNNSARDKEKQIQPEVQSQGNQESQLASEVDNKLAVVTEDRQSQISASSSAPSAQPAATPAQSTIAATENKSVQAFNSENSQKQAFSGSRIDQESAAKVKGTDELASMFARHKVTPSGDALGAGMGIVRTASFAATQSDLNTDKDKKLQQLGANMQAAFASGAQGASVSIPANTPILATNNPSPTSPNNRRSSNSPVI